MVKYFESVIMMKLLIVLVISIFLLQLETSDPEDWTELSPSVEGIDTVYKIIITIETDQETYVIRNFIACGNISEGISLSV